MEKRGQDSFFSRPAPPRGLPRTITHLAGLFEETRCEVGVRVHEKNLGSSYLTLGPKSKSLCSFILFSIQSTEVLHSRQ